ncbi:MAG: hypothetical protein RLZZ400_531 [Actinomycetota bacterium]
MEPKFEPLRLGDTRQLHVLLTDPRVAKHMPLADLSVSLDWVESWKKSKSEQWPDENMGPWVVFIDDRLGGWAGVQPDTETTVELAIVLHTWAWNQGRAVALEALRRWKSFGDPREVVIYLPESRDVETIARRLELSLQTSVVFDGRVFHRLGIKNSKLEV